ncbi:uncharacterized protein MELLADRAFT_75326 [Melampsora larici-populina 98AG31]|uniref:Uncharacterized protein n=1 Tax=Melampsora larici-populina (strain 98AG31 / pathotype 3-4-7) TaxID=747676 RepID=F4RW51_MELLP|nr:uncharacterized protein MELLADRAFT_75326 [Melampsora larici-populina 98AG31]EGG03379.1 hypothetical protein MELLADRAFT_75326 [Melampsora larici-populina 98AG31]
MEVSLDMGGSVKFLPSIRSFVTSKLANSNGSRRDTRRSISYGEYPKANQRVQCPKHRPLYPISTRCGW